MLKCQVPSFVADFVSVISWHTDQGDDFYPSSDFGNADLPATCKNKGMFGYPTTSWQCLALLERHYLYFFLVAFLDFDCLILVVV